VPKTPSNEIWRGFLFKNKGFFVKILNILIVRKKQHRNAK